MHINGTTAVVTGAGNGIGRAIALALGKAGANVVASDIDLDQAKQVTDELTALDVKALPVQVDVSDDTQVDALAQQAWEAFGSAEILVNNAGISHPLGPVWSQSRQTCDWCFGVNVGGVVNGLRAFVPRFIEHNQPSWIINTASEHGLGVPHLGNGLYTATKHAILGLSDVLRRETPPTIGVSVLCPGLADTSLWKANERRPLKFGGPQPAEQIGAAALSQGMPSEQIAEHVLWGIQEEVFLLVTHPHSVAFAEERWATISAAFEQQAPRFDGDTRYDVNEVIQRLQNGSNQQRA